MRGGWMALVALLGPAAAWAAGATVESVTPAPGAEQELPKVLYVVPWKDPATGDPVAAPVIHLDEGFLAPLNRDAFRRQLQYQAGLIDPRPVQPPAPIVR